MINLSNETLIKRGRIIMLNANELLQKAIAQVKAQGIEPGEINPNVKIIRNVQRFGRCSRQNDGTYVVELNELLLGATEKAAMTTMVHEVLHSCKGCMNHGAKWKSYTRILNNAYGYNIKTCSTYEERGVEQPKGKYTVQCQNKECGTKYEKNRMSGVIRNPERYTCGTCRGKLAVTFNDVTTQAAAEAAVASKPKSSTRKSATRPGSRKTSGTRTKATSTKTTAVSLKSEYKYVIQCKKCKKEYGRNRMSKAVKNVSAYKCRCGGSLKLL